VPGTQKKSVPGTHFLGGFRSFFERLIHHLESLLCLVADTLHDERRQNSSKNLLLDKPDFVFIDWLNFKTVFPIE
jgi:hypothetical protein